jgi:hypothetical protein
MPNIYKPSPENANNPLLAELDLDNQLDVQNRWNQFLKASETKPLTPEETSLAVTCTQILRRTNTGPAKAKTSKRAPKLSAEELEKQLLE